MSQVNTVSHGGALSELEMAAWGGFLRTHSNVVRELDEELTRVHSLPLSSYDVLVQLEGVDEGRLRLSQLADAVLLSRSGLSRLVARLVAQGLLERQECASDARGAFAAITERGRARLAEARETHRAGVRQRFLDRIDDEQKRELAEAWAALREG